MLLSACFFAYCTKSRAAKSSPSIIVNISTAVQRATDVAEDLVEGIEMVEAEMVSSTDVAVNLRLLQR